MGPFVMLNLVQHPCWAQMPDLGRGALWILKQVQDDGWRKGVFRRINRKGRPPPVQGPPQNLPLKAALSKRAPWA
jgi:hypothetical protein